MPIEILEQDQRAADAAIACDRGVRGTRRGHRCRRGAAVSGEERLEVEKMAAFLRLAGGAPDPARALTAAQFDGWRTLLSDPDWIQWLGLPKKRAAEALARLEERARAQA